MKMVRCGAHQNAVWIAVMCFDAGARCGVSHVSPAVSLNNSPASVLCPCVCVQCWLYRPVCSKGRSRKLCLRDLERAAEIVDVFGKHTECIGVWCPIAQRALVFFSLKVPRILPLVLVIERSVYMKTNVWYSNVLYLRGAQTDCQIVRGRLILVWSLLDGTFLLPKIGRSL